MRPVHPGEILRNELNALGMSANALTSVLGAPVNRATTILNGQRGITADTALRLARYFGKTPQLWLNLQKAWELRCAEFRLGRESAEQVKRQQSAALGTRADAGDSTASNPIYRGRFVRAMEDCSLIHESRPKAEIERIS